MIDWIHLESEDQLDQIVKDSYQKPAIILKHSTTCPISSIAKLRLDQDLNLDNVDMYYLDLHRYRSISNKVAELFMIVHESPQVLIIKDGDCIFDESHLAIQVDEIKAEL